MDVTNFYIKCSGIEEENTVSKALGLMKKYNLEELPVIKNRKYSGMIYLKDIVLRNIDAKNTNVKTLKTNAPHVKKNDKIEKVISLIFDSGLKSFAVVDKKVIGVVRQEELLEVVPEKIIEKNLDNIISPCITAYETDPIGKIKNMLKEENLSQIIILNKENKMCGIIRNIDLVKSIKRKDKNEQLGDIIPSEKIEAKSIMSNFFICEQKASIRDILKKIKKYGDIIIVDGETPIGVITPKNILELVLLKPSKGVNIKVTGLKDEDEITKHEIDAELNNFVTKISKFFKKMQYIFVDVERFHTGGGRVEYSILARLKTSGGLFVSKSHKWELLTALQEALNKLEKLSKKKYQKLSEKRKK